MDDDVVDALEKNIVPTHKFIITRHGLSCNNITGNLVGVFKKGSDPSLTDIGLQTARTLFENTLKPADVPRPTVVYVSSMIRTWMTAAAVYSDNTPLRLIVSPYLKELDKRSYDLGNMPDTPSEQLIKWESFLDVAGLKNIEVFFYATGNKLNSTDNYDRYDGQYTKYSSTGIEQFCNEMTTENKLGPDTLMRGKPIHVVAHSNLMQACVLRIKGKELYKAMKKGPLTKSHIATLNLPETDLDKTEWFKQNLWTMKLTMQSGCLKIDQFINGAEENESKTANPLCARDKNITSIAATDASNFVQSKFSDVAKTMRAVPNSMVGTIPARTVQPAQSFASRIGNFFNPPKTIGGKRFKRASSSSFSSRRVFRRGKISRRVRRR